MRTRTLACLLGISLPLVACVSPRSAHVPAQHAQDSLLVDGLFFTGRSDTRGGTADTLVVAVELQNRRNVPLRLDYGACVLEPRLMRAGRESTQPAWALSARPDSSLRRRNDGTIGVLFTNACLMYLVTATIAPGERISPREFQWREGLDSVAADSLHGTFRVIARLTLQGKRFDVGAGILQLK